MQEQSDGKQVILLFPKGIKQILNITSQCKSDVVQLASVAKYIRNEMFQEESKFKFDGHFPSNCQKDSVPYSLKLLVSMILNGPSLKNDEINIDSQNSLTISQLILFNSKKNEDSFKKKYTRHSLDREPPLPVYISLNIHSIVCSKKLIDQLNSFGITISYDRVLQLENDMALSMCKQYQANNVVCPSHLRKGAITVGAMDNLDHDPSSSTAHSSFHGTGISVIQFPTADNAGTLLPLFTEKVDTPAMIKHAMNILKITTLFLNPDKFQLWRVIAPFLPKPNLSSGHGQQLMEKTNLSSCSEACTGKWECGTCWETIWPDSGWTTALADAGVATAGTADSFLILTRTRHAHQLTCVALDSLQRQAFNLIEDELSFEAWRKDMIKKSPTFKYFL